MSTPHNPPAGRLTTLTAVCAVFAAMGLTAAESAFGSADAAARAAIEATVDLPELPCTTPSFEPSH